MSMVLGGPSEYEGKLMREGHSHLNLKEEHFNRVVEHLAATLKGAGVTDDLIG